MSNPSAIAAVTLTLQTILGEGVRADAQLNDTTVTLLPPDKARGSNNANQLNLFLYQVLPDAAWRNLNLPRQVAPGETGNPPLAVTMHYMLTAFGRDNDVGVPFGHYLLGQAMSVLFDHAVLGQDEIRSATAIALPGSDLFKQVERVRVTWQPLSLEEISKLWTGLATQYRLSVIYEVSVALIESTRATRAPLPVLTRGANDKGVLGQASLISPFPALDGITFPNQQTVARLGDTLTLQGQHLDGSSVGVVFNSPLWSAPVEIAPLAGNTATSLKVALPNSPAAWPAGFYTAAVMVQRPGESFRRTTNLLSFALAPRITIAPASTPAAASIAYTVTCAPEIRPDQRASLLIGDNEVLANAHAVQTATLTFTVNGLQPGVYFVRLRVDGVDSILVDRTVSPPVFDTTQQVTVT
jgi:Pvc16 N-terminal domain